MKNAFSEQWFLIYYFFNEKVKLLNRNKSSNNRKYAEFKKLKMVFHIPFYPTNLGQPSSLEVNALSTYFGICPSRHFSNPVVFVLCTKEGFQSLLKRYCGN